MASVRRVLRRRLQMVCRDGLSEVYDEGAVVDFPQPSVPFMQGYVSPGGEVLKNDWLVRCLPGRLR